MLCRSGFACAKSSNDTYYSIPTFTSPPLVQPTNITSRLEGYDWRQSESRFNSILPQYRTTIRIPSSLNPATPQALRIHFVHKRSKQANAIPLLLCHTWPSSFIEVQRIIDGLVDPVLAPGEEVQAFHVVAPSVPGFGFSEAGVEEGFGVWKTAEVFVGLMGRLGYTEGFVSHGVGWYVVLFYFHSTALF